VTAADSFPACVMEAPWAEVVPHVEARHAFMHHFLQLVVQTELAAVRMKRFDTPGTEYVQLERRYDYTAAARMSRRDVWLRSPEPIAGRSPEPITCLVSRRSLESRAP